MGARKRQQTGVSGAWELAGRQHGVISRAQLDALGYGAKAVRRRLEYGRLHTVVRGVYAVGRPGLSREGRWMAAVLACGSGAVLSHGSAAALWRIGWERGGAEVSVARSSHLKRPAVTVHRRKRLYRPDIAVCNGIPVTSAAQTMLDHGVRLGQGPMERMIDAADHHGLITPDAFREYLRVRPRQEGVGRLKDLMDRRAFRFKTTSELERWFLPLAEDADAPAPRTQALVNGFKVDFYWPALGLVVETDGLHYHRTPAQQARDRIRDQTHTAAGLTPLRFTHDQIRYEPRHVVSVLTRTVRRLAAHRAA
jgi:very-short-patch-repair endonuclease